MTACVNATDRIGTYWTCQLLGWGVMFGYNILITASSTLRWPETWAWAYYGMLATLGLLITHACRRWLLQRIRTADLIHLIGLTVMLGVSLGPAWTLLGDILFQRTGLFPDGEGYALEGLHYLRIAMGGVLTMVTWFAFYFGARMLRTAHAAELARVSAELALREQHIRLLQGRLRPHFLFNTLNSIHFLVDPLNDRARTAISQFADLMRFQLDQRVDGETAVTRELEMLDSYIQLQQLRMDVAVQVERNTEGDLKRMTIPAFVCFNIVENAFKHLVADTVGQRSIHISILVTRERLRLLVVNTCGTEGAAPSDGQHGLDDTRSTLKLLRPGRHLFVLNHDGGQQRYTADLTIELNRDEMPGR